MPFWLRPFWRGFPQDREHGYYRLRGYSDSETAVCISKMSTLLRKVRHIEFKAAFLQELVSEGRFSLEHIPGSINPAGSLTKSPTTSNLSSLYGASGLVYGAECLGRQLQSPMFCEFRPPSPILTRTLTSRRSPAAGIVLLERFLKERPA